MAKSAAGGRSRRKTCSTFSMPNERCRGGRLLAAAIGINDDIGRQHLAQRRHVALARGREEGRSDIARPVRPRPGSGAWPPGHGPARAPPIAGRPRNRARSPSPLHQSPCRTRRAAERRRAPTATGVPSAIIKAEGQVVGIVFRRAVPPSVPGARGRYRFPAAPAPISDDRGRACVTTLARNACCVLYPGAVRLVPAQIGFLDHVLRLRHRPQHAISDPHEPRTMRCEGGGGVLRIGHDHFGCGVWKATLMRFQALMVVMAKVSCTCSSGVNCACRPGNRRPRRARC